MNNKEILITGINGFMGRSFLTLLLKLSPDAVVYGIDRIFSGSEHFRALKCDLTSMDEVRSVLRKISPDYIFHFAGIAYAGDWDTLFSANVKSTLNILEYTKEMDLHPRIVIIGSAAEYGKAGKMPVDEMVAPNPASPYGASMCCRTNIALSFMNTGSDIAVGRVFNTTGPGVTDMTPVGSFAKQIAQIEKGIREPFIQTGNLTPERDFIDIDDVSRAFYSLAFRSNRGGIYNICSGKSHSIAAILDIYKGLSHRTFSVIADPALIRRNDIVLIYGDNRKIVSETGWRPDIELHESLEKTLAYYRKAEIC